MLIFDLHEIENCLFSFDAAQGEMSLCLDNSYSFSADKLVCYRSFIGRNPIEGLPQSNQSIDN